MWKRRDDFLPTRGVVRVPEDAVQTEGTSPTNNMNYGIGSGAGSPSSGGYPTTALQARPQSRKVNTFPISAAFKKGVDSITRSGSIEYTVRGSLHWLGVMKDWQWQGMILHRSA